MDPAKLIVVKFKMVNARETILSFNRILWKKDGAHAKPGEELAELDMDEADGSEVRGFKECTFDFFGITLIALLMRWSLPKQHATVVPCRQEHRSICFLCKNSMRSRVKLLSAKTLALIHEWTMPPAWINLALKHITSPGDL